jgi:hypothetical protein
MSRPITPLLPRLMARVQEDANGCWVYPGTNRSGYGQISIGSRGAHRVFGTHVVTYTHFVAPVPDGLQLDHLCRNRACCNPWHLEPVTCQENLRRGNGASGLNYRKTHCRHGHPFNEVNTYRDRDGRHCRPCHARRMAESRARRAAIQDGTA